MGISIHCMTFGNEVIETILDGKDVLARALTQKAVEGTCCLRFIDPYGVTVFNWRQLEVLVEELGTLAEKAADEESRDYLLEIQSLARKCFEDTGLLLRFLGD